MRRPSSFAGLIACVLLLQACGEQAVQRPGSPENDAGPSPGTRAVGELVARAQAKAPILFIGLDGADWQQLEPLLARGALPHLAGLRAASAWGELESEVPALSPLLWTSFPIGNGLHGDLTGHKGHFAKLICHISG